MARFKYMGEQPRSFVTSYGPTKKLAIPKNGGKIVLEAPTPAGFPVGQVIDYDFDDKISLLMLRSDPRFQEV